MVSTVRPPHHYGYGSEYERNSERNQRERHHNREHHHRDLVPNNDDNKLQPTRFLRLVWDEKGVVLEYTLRFNNTRRGFWMSSSPQKGIFL